MVQEIYLSNEETWFSTKQLKSYAISKTSTRQGDCTNGLFGLHEIIQNNYQDSRRSWLLNLR
jgi:hypothetical protein